MIYLALVVFLVGVFWLLNRQYAIIDRIPARLQIAYERNGGRSPAWLADWAHWITLTPIERSFDTVNRSLRLLGKPPTFYATPTERAKSLETELPVVTDAVESLLKQHLASLFTPEPGNVKMARRASFTIWLYTMQSIVKKFLYGRPVGP